jgi:hypothetical protein
VRDRYGASPVHLAGHLAVLGVAAWALVHVFARLEAALEVVVWLVAAIVLHDLLLLPAYSGLDRIAARLSGAAINHVRVPAGICLLLLLVFLPVIAGKGDAGFRRVSGDSLDGYLGRWLLVSALLFAASGVVYAVRPRRRA